MRISCTLTLCLFVVSTFAQSINQKIGSAYSRFEQDAQLQYATSSLTVLNGLTGEVIFSHNGSMGLAPASTLKTVTSATAYYLLGQDFTWQTTLGYSGQISANGTLNGDLILTGGGDPTLGSFRYSESRSGVILKKWAEAIRNAGIIKITGRVIADDRLFGTQTLPLGWIWQDIGNYYGAGPNSLTWNENQFNLIFHAGDKVGDPAVLVKAEPTMSYLKIVNEVKTGKPGSGDNVYAFSSPYSDIIYLRGTYGIDLQKVIKASVPDPALEAVILLQDTLKRLGMVIDQPATTTRILAIDKLPIKSPDKIIAVQLSPRLDQVIYWFNQKSINLYGEQMVKTLGWKFGKENSTTGGVEVIQDFWSRKLGIDPHSMNIIDGSGLSPGTRITTLSMARILQSVKKESWFSGYYASLPLNNNMKMKSGSVNDVLAYAGYQTTSSGIPVVFSFIINNYNGSTSSVRNKMFGVLDILK